MTARRVLAATVPAFVGVVVAVALLLAVGADPFAALGAMVSGSVGSGAKLADTILAWSPLAIISAGLVVTFRAGLWNIGVEGQVTAGAIAATAFARSMPGPGRLVMVVALAAGLVGGALWGLGAGVLRVKGNVNEIFGGLGLGFVAQSIVIYLVIGPWKRAGIASTSGTEPFREEVWLPVVGSTQLSLIAPLMAIAVIASVWWSLGHTRFGLHLKAVGSNLVSARLVGIRSEQVMLGGFAIGGGLAGMAGGLIALGIQHKLVPSIAGGRGFLAILVVLLAGQGIRWVAPVALFFAAVSVGASQLNLRLDLDSSLGGVLQGVIVLVAIVVGGVRARRAEDRQVAG